MNKNRRRRLRQVIDQAKKLLEQLEAIREEEQDAVDNTPEGLQGTDRYAMMEQAAETLQEEWDNLEEIIESLEGLIWTP